MPSESNKNDVLQSVTDTDKNDLHKNHHHENVITIESTLNTTYEQKSLGGIDAKHDAKHDAKIIALKYFSGSYKNNELTKGLDKSAIGINVFVTVRNELGKDFFDNLLYKYDVPYCQIEELANELSALQNDQQHELLDNDINMKARLNNNGQPISSQVAEITPKASSSNQNIESEQGESPPNLKVYETLSNIIGFNVLKCSAPPERAEADKRFVLKPLQSFDKKTVEGMIANLNESEKVLMKEEVKNTIQFFGNEIKSVGEATGLNSEQIKTIQSQLTQLNELLSKNKSDNTYGLTSKIGPEQAKKNSDALSKQENNLKQEMKNMYLPEGFPDKMVGPIMNRWYGRINEKVRSYNIGKVVDKQLTQQQLNDLTYRSPFRQESCAGAIPDIQDLYVGDLMKNIAQAFIQDPENKRCNNLTPQNIGSVLQSYTKIIDQSQKDTFVGNNTIISEAKNNVYTKKVFQEFVDQFENGKSDASTAKSAIDVLVKSGKGFVDMALGFLKSPAMQELFKEVKKIFELLGRSTSMFDNISKLNEVATGDLTVLQVATLDAGQKLCKEQKVTTSTDPALTNDGTGVLKPDFLKIGEMMNSKIFNKEIGGYGSDRINCDLWSKGFMDKVGKNNYQLLFKEYTASTGIQANDADLLDLSMWNMCGKNPNNAEFQQFQELRKQDSHEAAAALYQNKITTMVVGLADKPEVKNAKWGENANESATRIIFGNLIAGEKGAKSVIDAKQNTDTQKEQINEAQKNVEINKFKNKITLEHKNGKLIIEPNPKDNEIKILVDGIDKTYDSTTGLTITNLQKLSLISTDDTHTKTRKEEIRVNDITLLDPKMTQGTDGKITLPGLDSQKAYTGKITYADKSESTDQTIGAGQARELTIGKEKTPSYLILKQDDNGVKQRFAFPKKA